MAPTTAARPPRSLPDTLRALFVMILTAGAVFGVGVEAIAPLMPAPPAMTKIVNCAAPSMTFDRCARLDPSTIDDLRG